MTEVRRQDGAAAEAGVAGEAFGAVAEDLFVFDVGRVTLREGERMVVPVARYELPYRDVYALDIPFAPPAEMQQHARDERARTIERLLAAPAVMHRVRLENRSPNPLTTAPAVILRQGRILGQGLLTYTPKGASVDLDVTKAVGILAGREEEETARTPNASQWHNSTFDRIDLAGTIRLANHTDKAVTVEVSQGVLGWADKADANGAIAKLNALEERGPLVGSALSPAWEWWWYSWPHWWHHVNGVARVTWRVDLEPGKSAELRYSWHYFWD